MQNTKKPKLDDLPESENDFWKGADKHIVKLEKKICEHKFIYKKETEGIAAECMNCRAGWILSPGCEVKGNHIYLHGELVI